MEIINQVADMISQYGLFTVLSAVGLGLLIWKGKEIGGYIVTTLQASALVKKKRRNHCSTSRRDSRIA